MSRSVNNFIIFQNILHHEVALIRVTGDQALHFPTYSLSKIEETMKAKLDSIPYEEG